MRLTQENQGTQPETPAIISRRIMSGLIALMAVTLAVFTWMAPPHIKVLHNILHHLNILPFMLAGLMFGWKGAARTVFLVTLLQIPSITRHWHSAPLAQEQIVELSTFGATGLFAGFVANRERLQRRRVEATQSELERAYTELQENIEQLRKHERLSAAGVLSASLAHEIRNPLASISGAAGILSRGNASAESRGECLTILNKESQRLNRLLTNFLDFARPRLPRFQFADPVAIVQSTLLLAQYTAESFGVTLRMDAASDLREVQCDPEQIKQVLLNLMLNAVQASDHGDMVVVHVSGSSEWLSIEVCDEGRGIPQEELESIFAPFSTTKENGTGLGLAVASNIVGQHGGRLTGIPNANRGMTFCLLLPWERSDIPETYRANNAGVR
jgi:two-component system sensor histidine kinase HydH